MLELAAMVFVALGFGGVDPDSYYQNGWHHAAVGRTTIPCPDNVDRSKVTEAVIHDYAARPPVKGDGQATAIRILCEKDSRVIQASLFVATVSDTEAVYELNESYEVIGKFLRSPDGVRRW